MQLALPHSFSFALLAALLLAHTALSDPVIPSDILNPKTAPEAWNVVRLATRNVALLLEENRLAEIPVQISFCSPALRTFPGMVTDPEAVSQVEALTKRAFISVNAVAVSAQQNNSVGQSPPWSVSAIPSIPWLGISTPR